jgi:hypothetical protein
MAKKPMAGKKAPGFMKQFMAADKKADAKEMKAAKPAKGKKAY